MTRCKKRQVEILVEFVYRNKCMINGNKNDPKVQKLWMEITLKLNKFGVQKHYTEWYNTYMLLARKAKMKARKINSLEGKGDSEEGGQLQMNPVELKLISTKNEGENVNNEYHSQDAENGQIEDGDMNGDDLNDTSNSGHEQSQSFTETTVPGTSLDFYGGFEKSRTNDMPISNKQKTTMLNFLEKNSNMVSCVGSEKLDVDIEIKWRTLAKQLNGLCPERSKTAAQWKETYKSLATEVKRKNKSYKSDSDVRMTKEDTRLLKLLNLHNSSQDDASDGDEKCIVKIENSWEDDPLNNADPIEYDNQDDIDEEQTDDRHESQSDFIIVQRNKMQERLMYGTNATNLQRLTDSINNLAGAFTRVAQAMDGVTDKVLKYLKR